MLTNDGAVRVESNDVATADFWATGESDISSLLSAVAAAVHEDVSLSSVMDFGCGVGRLTLPLARRAKSVVACDIAPTMLEHVRRNAREAGLSNVTLLASDRMDSLPDAQFSFICSLLTLQYIPRAMGYSILRSLLRLLAPGGIAVLHLVLAPPGETLRQLVRTFATRSRAVRAGAKRDSSSPESLPLYAYDATVVIREVVAADAHVVGRLDTDGTLGEVLVIRKDRPGESCVRS